MSAVEFYNRLSQLSARYVKEGPQADIVSKLFDLARDLSAAGRHGQADKVALLAGLIEARLVAAP